MKKIVGILVVALVVGTAIYWVGSKKTADNLGRSNFATFSTLAGSSSNFVSLPREAVFANSTTTDAAVVPGGYLDGGATITQSFNTDGYDWVQLGFAAQGGTATSTLFVRLQLYDGTDWSDVYSSSTPASLGNNTSTVIVLSPTGFNLDPGTASTTFIRYPFYVHGSQQGRVIMYADDLTADPTDGVQIWAKVIKIEPFQR